MSKILYSDTVLFVLIPLLDLTQPGSSPAIQLTDDLPTLLTKDLFHLLIEAMGATMVRPSEIPLCFTY